MGVQVQDRIRPDLLEDGEIDLIFGQQLAQGAFFDGGISLYLRAVRVENHVSAAFQING